MDIESVLGPVKSSLAVAGCNCWTCVPRNPLFVACRDCGNKRCPKATDHALACTGSNEVEQAGSVYGPEDALSARYLSARTELMD